MGRKSYLCYLGYDRLARFMNISRASVCRAVYLLEQEELVDIDGRSNIILTAKGEKSAKEVIERYKFFKDFLMSIGIDEENAAIDACNLEHALREDSFEQLKLFLLSNNIV